MAASGCVQPCRRRCLPGTALSAARRAAAEAAAGLVAGLRFFRRLLPVLQPLIGMDKEEIVRLARKIGTFETSILPYEDCCTVFTPKHPKTKPKLRDVEQIESALDIDALVEEAYAGIERIKVGD